MENLTKKNSDLTAANKEIQAQGRAENKKITAIYNKN